MLIQSNISRKKNYFNNIHSTVLIMVLWNIWRRGNYKLFPDVSVELHITASKIADDLMLWSNRYSNGIKRGLLMDWSTMLYHLSMRFYFSPSFSFLLTPVYNLALYSSQFYEVVQAGLSTL